MLGRPRILNEIVSKLGESTAVICGRKCVVLGRKLVIWNSGLESTVFCRWFRTRSRRWSSGSIMSTKIVVMLETDPFRSLSILVNIHLVSFSLRTTAICQCFGTRNVRSWRSFTFCYLDTSVCEIRPRKNLHCMPPCKNGGRSWRGHMKRINRDSALCPVFAFSVICLWL